jgi:hypothetical protein
VRHLKLEVPYVQPSIGWCTVYLLANILKDKNLLRLCEDPNYKACDETRVEAMLLMSVPELKMGLVTQSNPAYPPLPKEHIWNVVMMEEAPGELFVETPIVPYHLTVRLIPSMFHAVGILKLGNVLHYLDPRRKEMVILRDADHLMEQFMDCWVVERPYLREDKRWAILRGENLGYETIETE